MGIREKISTVGSWLKSTSSSLTSAAPFVVKLILVSLATVVVFSIAVSIYVYFTQPSESLPNLRNIAQLAFVALVALLVARGYDGLDPFGLGIASPSESAGEMTRDELISEIRNRSSSDYELIAEIAEVNSPTTAEHLREIQNHTTATEPFDDLSNSIRAGIHRSTTSPIQDAIRIIERLINAKEYVEAYPDSELRIIRFDGDKVNIRTDSKNDELKTDMVFEVRIKRLSASGESITEPIGTARIKHVSDEVANMHMMKWHESTNSADVEELQDGNLTNKDPTVAIPNPEVLIDIEMRYLERIRDDLKSIDDRR